VSSIYPQSREYRETHYTLLEAPHPGRARFTFNGPFHGNDTCWDATLITLAQRRTADTTASLNTHAPFIEIGNETGHGRALTVALDIPIIDEATILRTIIMIRQYKRLRPGRHEFGDTPGR
jgi:hypothetical protein